MPKEITRHGDVLAAIESIGAIADLTAKEDGHFEYELDLEVIVYGRNYNGKSVGPYVRLLSYEPGEEIVREGDWGGNTFYIVVSGNADVLVDTPAGMSKISEIPEGVQFGEMSVLAGVPRAATVRAPQNGTVRVLELQRPALRLLRKLPKFSEILDNTYRRNGRSLTIQGIKAETGISDEAIRRLELISKFHVYAKNHTLYRAGDQIRSLYVLKTGWARLSPRTGPIESWPEGDESPDWQKKSESAFVGPLHCFGVEAITRDTSWGHTCTLLGRSEVLEISISKLRQHPELRETLLLAFSDVAIPQDLERNRRSMPVAKSQGELIETGLVEATNLLVMDMELCVRCGNCSMACHQIHGKSRLLRRGIHIERPVNIKTDSPFQSLLAPAVCLHCKDPECLTGCPTGAIGRFPDGQVDIDPKSCIGCGDCATQCPYNAISMVPRNSPPESTAPASKKWLSLSPDPLPDPVEQTDDLLAVKCNLCSGTSLNPPSASKQAYSCEENCPTGSLLRVDPAVYFAEIKNIQAVIYRDANRAMLRHASHKDSGKQIAHAVGLVLTLLLTGLAVAGLIRNGLEMPLAGAWLNMRWMTGLAGLAGIAGVMAYPVRRKIYRRRAGPLRYWMIAHSYLGVIAGILLLLHGGTSSGGVLTTALMISFDLVILTGLAGILIYQIAPRLLTRIEGQPLLIEDLQARREELNLELGQTMAAASPQARSLMEKMLIPKIFSAGFLLRQFLRRESLDRLITEARGILEKDADGLDPYDRGNFSSAIEKAATIRRIDAMILLHQMLKLWLAPHVVSTTLMLALMIVHIVQVIYFAAR